MENLREILSSFTQDDFYKNVNLHIHTSYSDGLGDPNQIVSTAKNRGMKLISITDHNTVVAHKKINDEILLTGVEFDCWCGYVFLHLLAYGIDINHPEIIPFLAKNKKETEDVIPRLFTRRNLKKLITAIHSAGGIAVLAHPACCWALNLEKFVEKLIKLGLDGIEIYYPYPRFRKFVKFHSEDTVLKIAEAHPELIKTGGTDFHDETF
jgi:predicted metal-dependent phosphoesterase TrpH